MTRSPNKHLEPTRLTLSVYSCACRRLRNMESKAQFEQGYRVTRRLELLVLWLGIGAVLTGMFWGFGALEQFMRRRLSVSDDHTFQFIFILMLVSCLAPLVLVFALRIRSGLFCPHCGPWRSPFNFPNYAIRHGKCPRCKAVAFSES